LGFSSEGLLSSHVQPLRATAKQRAERSASKLSYTRDAMAAAATKLAVAAEPAGAKNRWLWSSCGAVVIDSKLRAVTLCDALPSSSCIVSSHSI
jgi:hypothetical protein